MRPNCLQDAPSCAQRGHGWSKCRNQRNAPTARSAPRTSSLLAASIGTCPTRRAASETRSRFGLVGSGRAILDFGATSENGATPRGRFPSIVARSTSSLARARAYPDERTGNVMRLLMADPNRSYSIAIPKEVWSTSKVRSSW